MPPDLFAIDLKQFDLDRFQHMIEGGELLPSRRILLEDSPRRFAVLKNMGIHNLKDLVDFLGSKQRIAQFAQKSGLPQDYLEILVRQTRIYSPKPAALKDLPGVDIRYIEALAGMGIHNTCQLFGQAGTAAARASLSAGSGVPPDALLELAQLSDLMRAGWVGPIFARLFHKAGVRSVKDLSRQSPPDLFERLRAANQALQLTRAAFTLKDVASCIEIAGMLPIGLEY